MFSPYDLGLIKQRYQRYNNNIDLDGPIEFNNMIVSEENYSHSFYDESHSVNS